MRSGAAVNAENSASGPDSGPERYSAYQRAGRLSLAHCSRDHGVHPKRSFVRRRIVGLLSRFYFGRAGGAANGDTRAGGACSRVLGAISGATGRGGAEVGPAAPRFASSFA